MAAFLLPKPSMIKARAILSGVLSGLSGLPGAKFSWIGLSRAKALSLLFAGIALSSCGIFSGDEEIREGPRFTLEGEPIGGPRLGAQFPKAQFPAPKATDWSAHLANNLHIQPNAVLRPGPELAASIDLGVAGRRPVYGASAPIIIGERIYHYDAGGILHAFTLAGGHIWSQPLIPPGEQSGDGFGGGLAYQSGTIYAATGYGEALAVDAKTGNIKWRYAQKHPFRKAPVVAGNRLILLSGGTQALALDITTGRVAWRRYAAQANIPSRVNAGTPGIVGNKVAIAFTTGEVALVELGSGREIWSVPAVSDYFSGAKASTGDVTVDPIIAGNHVFIGTKSGVAALNLANGTRKWVSNIGSKGPLIIGSNSIFGLTHDGRMFRLARAGGQLLWVRELPSRVSGLPVFNRIRHHDLRLASGELLLADTRGTLRAFDPDDGSQKHAMALSMVLANAPIFAQGRMVGITETGYLVIFR